MEQTDFLYHCMSTSINETFSLFLPMVWITLFIFSPFILISCFSLVQYFPGGDCFIPFIYLLFYFIFSFPSGLLEFLSVALLDSYQHDESSELPASPYFLYSQKTDQVNGSGKGCYFTLCDGGKKELLRTYLKGSYIGLAAIIVWMKKLQAMECAHPCQGGCSIVG